MRRSFHIYGLVLVLLLIFGLFPMACSKSYTWSPTAPMATSTPAGPINTPTFTATPTPSVPWVSTLAGSGSIGTTNGTGTAASFDNPYGLAVDPFGNIYVADYYNNKIRVISPSGVVTILAGSGTAGSSNGTGAGASFNGPFGIAIDTLGNLYVTDFNNNLIRKVTPGGVVSTFAGSGTQGYVNATGTGASFYDPTGIGVDASNNVYVCDSANEVIREITPGGVVSTFAGVTGFGGFVNGAGTIAQFNWPDGVVADSSGNLYVSDQFNNMVRKITPGAVVSTLAGSGTAGSANGTGGAASFYWPCGIAIDSSGNLYMTDEFNNSVREITQAGVVTTLAGTGSKGSTNGLATVASFNEPGGIAVDSSGDVYVGDTFNNLIRKITP
jgi:serine/threonine protein kinase, bacterial